MLLAPLLNVGIVILAIFLTSKLVEDFRVRKNKTLAYSILLISCLNFLLLQVLPLILLLVLLPGPLFIFGIAVTIVSAIVMPGATFLAFFVINLVSIKIADRYTTGFKYNKTSSLFVAAAITAGLQTLTQVNLFKV